MSLTPDQLSTFVQTLAADAGLWQPHVHHDPERRTFQLIWNDEHVNAWVLCWSKDHDTGFHDHDVSAAAITVVDGRVREDRLRLNGASTTNFYGAGRAFVVPPAAIHRVLHDGDGPAVTIHAYSPPLTRMGAYEVDGNGELLREVWDGESAIEADMAGVAPS